VHVREALARARSEPLTDIGPVISPVPFVPISMAAPSLLRELQRTRTHLAVAVDEQGTVRGLVTMGDLVEELVGSMLSEEDRPSDNIVAELEGRFIAPAATPIREVNRVLGLDLPATEEASTLGGLVLGVAGKIPVPGEEFELQGVGFEVVAASRRRVKVVRITTPNAVLRRTPISPA
jgi:putative hemolysin